ncbi:MAG: PDZ domain-containing protein [Fimbriimonadaceae bacterium]|nr:PDZ domain-containing protein [Fimbriimonadaceae bacterium]
MPVTKRTRDEVVWERLAPSLVILRGDLGEPTGVGVLIDERGLFLTHQSQLPRGLIVGQFIDGSTINLKVVGRDNPTQLACLEASELPSSKRVAVRLASQDEPAGSLLTAITLGGPVSAQQTANAKAGVVKPSLRYLPVNEIMLERTSLPVGGAMLFNETGSLVGFLGATIEPVNVTQNLMVEPTPTSNTRVYGPQGLTVGYSLGPKVLRRVVAGFRSPDHQVEHPSLGLQFRNAPDPGALIVSLDPNGSAAKGGIQAGDVVVALNGRAIQRGLDLALALFESEVGELVEVTVIRNGKKQDFSLRITGQIPSASR